MNPPPHDIKTELSLISLIINEAGNLPKIAGLVTANDFYSITHRNNFRIALDSYKKDGIVDTNKMDRVYDYLEESAGYVSSLWIPKLCKELKELSKKRAMLRMADEISTEAVKKTSSDLIQQSMRTITSIVKETQVKETSSLAISKNVLEHWEKTKDQEIIGLGCGIKEIDEAISGMQPGHIWVVGGYTNYGKTTLAVSLMAHLLKTTNENYLFCSTEMSQNQIFEKIISNFTRETPTWNRKNCNMKVVKDSVALLSQKNLEITDDLNTVEGIIFKIQEMTIAKKRPKVVFIDFIQNIRGRGVSEYERVTNAILELQEASRRLDVCIFVLSQVNNQSPGISEVIGFKSSGALAAAADITIQIVRDKAKEMKQAAQGIPVDIVEMGLLIQKNRHGRGGYVVLEFDTKKGLILGH